MGTTPSVLFVAHGSPMFAIEPGATGAALHSLATELDRPRAVLVISPHWETMQPTVGTTEAMAGNRLETIHDFGGFDPRLYAIQYPATGSPQAAQEVVEALQTAGFAVATDPRRGLDHGAWVPLSIQASGNITHNLRDWQRASAGMGMDTSYARRFSDWVARQLEAGNTEALLDYRQQHPDAVQAQPRDEHLLPLFTALGAAGPEAHSRTVHRGISDHVIAMDSYAFERD